MLSAPRPRAALIAALAEVDRLVLLGDVIELRHGPLRDALAGAQETFLAIGAALKPGAEVVIVPGNHDHQLVVPGLERQARTGKPTALGLESSLDWRAGEALAALARWLGPASVRAAYPGVWLRDDVYALHGHYCDRHTSVPMFERLAIGATARIVGEPAGGPRRAEDYEAMLAPVYAWIHAVAQSGGPGRDAGSQAASAKAWGALAGTGRGRGLRTGALRVGFPALVGVLNRAGIGPLRADVSAPELRRAALRATREVLARLGVQARYVIFGHTHRAGPLSGDSRLEWRSFGGARLLNTGSWVSEPHFLGRHPQTSPYRGGFAVLLEDDRAPTLVNLLDLTRPGQLTDLPETDPA